jgi:hypothetical protein
MPTSKAKSSHTPAPDAPAKEWTAFLKGRGYLKDTQPKPVSNYKSLHGYWVPPRLGSPAGGGAAAKATAKSKAARGTGGPAPEKAWYSQKMLTALYRQDRATFDKLVERVQNIKELVAETEAAERIAEHRALLEPAVEAGLLNQAEADRKLAAWAKSQGLKLPKG